MTPCGNISSFSLLMLYVHAFANMFVMAPVRYLVRLWRLFSVPARDAHAFEWAAVLVVLMFLEL